MSDVSGGEGKRRTNPDRQERGLKIAISTGRSLWMPLIKNSKYPPHKMTVHFHSTFSKH